ncbi:hypothetical protein LJR235_002892 [Pararhizobium sp. LjRoot235]|uniref:hypothetical protein n=1 Tax=Pararhizobium sp. LjRoot235 TaxID=3342291 RepID=UPI003ECF6EA8
MNENFVFAASCICLLAGIALCFLPAARYWRRVAVGAFGPLLILMGVVLMTTFKWTEVAIKISDLEVKLAEAELKNTLTQARFAAVQEAVTPEGKSQTLQTLLTNYKQVAKTPPSDEQLANFNAALKAAKVTLIPVEAVTGVPDYSNLKFEPSN